MRSFRVIDCLSTKVVKAAKNCEYVALSYVWGKPLSSGPGGDLAFQNVEFAPKVILDSIELVKRLGLQYLWVDRYCINQANAQEKHDQICQVDMIYASAQFAIIAAASGDPNYGLPGVNGTSRNPQPAIKIGEQIIISTLDSPDTLLSRSEQQVFFECNSMHCVETVNLPLNAMREDAPQDFHGPFSTAGAFKTKATGIPSSFMSCIREFTMRKLSYETDALNAMSGVFSVFEKVHPAIFQLKGVPFMTRIAPGSPQTFTADYEFVIGLLWWHPDARQCCRRAIFPSWSWAGWAGPTGGSFRFNESAQMKCGVKMSVELPNKRLKPFPRQRKHIPPFLAKARDAKFIHFTAKTSACKIIKKATSLGLEHQLLYAALLVGDVSINIELSFFPDELILSEQGLASCLFREGLTAMILAYNSFESTPYYMSIIVAKQSRCGEYMERVGNVSMVSDFGNPKKSGGYSREIKDWLARRPVQTIRLG
ncbi:hypothetical protein HYALB_00006848 [Hymenoscyphus albidus]|uniref:Heterokaryon incompatibility domain-containing protein n=1 Tax=Hymenoscyphus albidus TaxID=595503 RepID=A0A9N9LJN0_9HELO|nr:hypothetical protein HYALB_00006848 [Hymenoscyphus albidus]